MSPIEINWKIISETVAQLLDRYGLDEPPVDPRELSRRIGIPLLKFSEFDLNLLSPDQRGRLDRLYGAYVPDQNGMGTIYVRDGLTPFQDKDTVSHELGHATMRHHREILLMGRKVLTPELINIMEEEARSFSIVLRLMGDKFDAEAAEYVYGLSTARFLAERFSLSYEMAFRRYVSLGPAGPILRVFDIHRRWRNGSTLREVLQYRYFVKPLRGTRLWIAEKPGFSLPPNHPLCAMVSEAGATYEPILMDDFLGDTRCKHEVLASRSKLYVLSKAC